MILNINFMFNIKYVLQQLLIKEIKLLCICRKALSHVQERRYCINPNEGFAQQLMVK